VAVFKPFRADEVPNNKGGSAANRAR
jgi:hypothetical protein